jgi:hypothetical protein
MHVKMNWWMYSASPTAGAAVNASSAVSHQVITWRTTVTVRLLSADAVWAFVNQSRQLTPTKGDAIRIHPLKDLDLLLSGLSLQGIPNEQVLTKEERCLHKRRS